MIDICVDILFFFLVVEVEVNESIQQNFKYVWEYYEFWVKFCDGIVLGEVCMVMVYGELVYIQMLVGQYDDVIYNV